MGTIWSTSPCRIRVGTAIFFRSSLVSLFRERLDGEVRRGKTCEHVLIPTGIERCLRNIGPRTIRPKINNRQVLHELRTVRNHPLAESIEGFKGCAGWIIGSFQQRWSYRTDQDDLGDALIPKRPVWRATTPPPVE